MGTYFALYGINIITLLFLFVLLHQDMLLDKHRKKSFLYAIYFTILIIIAEAGSILVNGQGPEWVFLNYLFNVIGFALTPFIPIILVSIFDENILKKFKILLIPTAINAVAVILSPFIGLIFSISADNQYQRGNIFILFVIVYIINAIILVASTSYNSQKRYYEIKYKIVLLAIFTILGTSIQLIFPEVYSSWHSVTIMLLILYLILSDFESNFDSLTRFYNRGAYDRVSIQFKDKKNYAVIMMDINNFKEVNDTYGHDFGDNILKEVSKIIQKSFDDFCTCYRIGGDELCIVRKNANETKLISQLNDMVVNLKETKINNIPLPMIAYGYSLHRDNEQMDFQMVIIEADKNMYLKKQEQKANKS